MKIPKRTTFLVEMGWLIGGRQTHEAVVPGSNLAWLTVENSEDRRGHCVLCSVYTVKYRGRYGNLPIRQKRKKKERKISRDTAPSKLCFQF